MCTTDWQCDFLARVALSVSEQGGDPSDKLANYDEPGDWDHTDIQSKQGHTTDTWGAEERKEVSRVGKSSEACRAWERWRSDEARSVLNDVVWRA